MSKTSEDARANFYAQCPRWHYATYAALPLALTALALVIVAALQVLPYNVQASHPVGLILGLVGGAFALALSAFLCQILPGRAFARWQEHDEFHRRTNNKLLSYVRAGAANRKRN